MLNDITIDQPVLTSGGITLRPVQPSDAGLFSFYAGDERVARMTRTIPHPFPPGAAEAYLANASRPDRTADIWTVDGTEAGQPEFMGMIMLDRLDRRQSEVSFWVAPAFWNMGVATDALRMVVDANPHEASRIFAEVFQDNPGSARVLTNCGFDYLGDAETHSVARGANVPTWTYSRKLDG